MDAVTRHPDDVDAAELKPTSDQGVQLAQPPLPDDRDEEGNFSEDESAPEFFEPEDLLELMRSAGAIVGAVGSHLGAARKKWAGRGEAVPETAEPGGAGWGALACSVGYKGWATLADAADFWVSGDVATEERLYLEEERQKDEGRTQRSGSSANGGDGSAAPPETGDSGRIRKASAGATPPGQGDSAVHPVGVAQASEEAAPGPEDPPPSLEAGKKKVKDNNEKEEGGEEEEMTAAAGTEEKAGAVPPHAAAAPSTAELKAAEAVATKTAALVAAAAAAARGAASEGSVPGGARAIGQGRRGVGAEGEAEALPARCGDVPTAPPQATCGVVRPSLPPQRTSGSKPLHRGVGGSWQDLGVYEDSAGDSGVGDEWECVEREPNPLPML